MFFSGPDGVRAQQNSAPGVADGTAVELSLLWTLKSQFVYVNIWDIWGFPFFPYIISHIK